jgi:hypothetical protein
MRVGIEGFQAKDGSKRLYGRELKLDDGRVLFLN